MNVMKLFNHKTKKTVNLIMKINSTRTKNSKKAFLNNKNQKNKCKIGINSQFLKF